MLLHETYRYLDKAAEIAVPLRNIFKSELFGRTDDEERNPERILDNLVLSLPYVRAQTTVGRDRFLILKMAQAGSSQLSGKQLLHALSNITSDNGNSKDDGDRMSYIDLKSIYSKEVGVIMSIEGERDQFILMTYTYYTLLPKDIHTAKLKNP